MNRPVVTNNNIHVAAAVVMAVLSMGFIDNAAMASTANSTNKKIHKIKEIKARYKKLLLKEKNIPTTVTHLGKKTLSLESSARSIYSILHHVPSVSVYQQNIGPMTPVFSVRGVRMSQIAQTLDGIPMQDLISGGELAGVGTISGNVGSLITSGQVTGISVYPGIAPPEKAGFATIGGTIAFTSKKPTKKFGGKIFTSVGSYDTNSYGAEVNTGTLADMGGLRVLMRVNKTSTDGYVQHTPADYRDVMLAFTKPFDYGLTKVSGLVLYNVSSGYFPYAGDAIPLAQQSKYGLFFNYPLSEAFDYEADRDITAILGEKSYINRWLSAGIKGFYIGRRNITEAYTNPEYINSSYPYQMNMLAPYFNDGPMGKGSGGPDYDFSYDPQAVFGSYQAGEAALYGISSYETVGAVPKFNIFLPHNTITIGGLIASENGTSSKYVYGELPMPTVNGYNSRFYDKETHRTVYSGYVEDNVTLINGRLKIEPGVTVTEADTNSFVPENIFNDPVGSYDLSEVNKSVQPYVGLSFAVARDLYLYGSYGKGVRFAPAGDYVIGTEKGSTAAPAPETVNAYQIGIRYDTSDLYLNLDGYLQKYNKLFGYVVNESTGFAQYSNVGRERGDGLEFTGDWRVTPNVTLSGNFSYNSQKYLNSFPAVDAPGESQSGFVYAGQSLPFVPDWLANIGVRYHVHNFTASLTGMYSGGSPSIKDTGFSTNPELDGAGIPDSAQPVGGFFLVNLAARYKVPVMAYGLKSLTFGLNVDNILNRKYYTRIYRIYKFYNYNPVGKEYAAGIPGMPRFIDLSLTAEF